MLPPSRQRCFGDKESPPVGDSLSPEHLADLHNPKPEGPPAIMTPTRGRWACERLDRRYIHRLTVGKMFGSIFVSLEPLHSMCIIARWRMDPTDLRGRCHIYTIPPCPFKDHEDQNSPDTLRAAGNHTRDFIWFHSITASTCFSEYWHAIFHACFPFLVFVYLLARKSMYALYSYTSWIWENWGN